MHRAYNILAENVTGLEHSGGLDLDGRIILKLILKKLTEFNWLRIRTSGGVCVRCNEPSNSIRGSIFGIHKNIPIFLVFFSP
jgi:hypothetical protein